MPKNYAGTLPECSQAQERLRFRRDLRPSSQEPRSFPPPNPPRIGIAAFLAEGLRG